MADFTYTFPHRRLLGIEGLNRLDLELLLARGGAYADLNRQRADLPAVLKGRKVVNLFIDPCPDTQSSFETAGRRLGADMAAFPVEPGEALTDTAIRINDIKPDLLVIRHPSAGAARLLARHIDCAIINAGDGAHEDPIQALLDALTIQRRAGELSSLRIAICGDILHSAAARSSILLLSQMGAQVCLIAPPTLLPAGASDWGVDVFTDMRRGLADCDIVMMVGAAPDRLDGAAAPSPREFVHAYGLDADKLAHAKPDACFMYSGAVNHITAIDEAIARDGTRSLIAEQAELGLAMRMAVLDMLANAPPAAEARNR